MPDGQHHRSVDTDAIERCITAPAVRDHQLTQLASNRPADERVIFEHRNSLGNPGSDAGGGKWIVFRNEVEQSIEISQGTRRVCNLHARRRGFGDRSGFGRAGFLPAPIEAARAAM